MQKTLHGPFLQNMPVNRSDNIFPALATAASLNWSPAFQSERVSVRCSVQFLNELMVSDKLFWSIFCYGRSQSVVAVERHQEKAGGMQEKFERCDRQKKVLLDSIRLMNAANWSTYAEVTASSERWKNVCL